MTDQKITDRHTYLLIMLHDGNRFYLNMATVNTYDEFYPLYQQGYVSPSPNNAVWNLTIKGILFVKAINQTRQHSISDNDKLLMFAFEQGIKYARRSIQDKISKTKFLREAIQTKKESKS